MTTPMCLDTWTQTTVSIPTNYKCLSHKYKKIRSKLHSSKRIVDAMHANLKVQTYQIVSEDGSKIEIDTSELQLTPPDTPHSLSQNIIRPSTSRQMSTSSSSSSSPVPSTSSFPPPVPSTSSFPSPIPSTSSLPSQLVLKGQSNTPSLPPTASITPFNRPSPYIATSSSRSFKDHELLIDDGTGHVVLGRNGTTISIHIFNSIDWRSSSGATRKILAALFERTVLGTHSLTGKPSPAFLGRERPTKNQLDAAIVSDIIYAVTKKSNCSERDVRAAITTKCSDENKMYRQRLAKQQKQNKENEPRND